MRMLMPILALTLPLLVGCQSSQQVAEAPSLDDQPLLDVHGRSRSLTFQPPELEAATQAMAGVPWYALRHDTRRAALTGPQTPTLQITRTYTVDRQSFHNNRARHHYDRTTYRYQVTEGMR